VEVARTQFAERGYRATTLSSIAAAAEVHRALLFHYFGTKQALYSEAIGIPVDPWAVLDQLLERTSRNRLPEALVRHFVSTWRDPQFGPVLRAQTRQTLGDAPSPSLAKSHLETLVFPRIAAATGIPESNVAAAISQLLGVVLMDSLLGLRQLSVLTEDELVALLAPAVRQTLRHRS
jgi:AcrR family transcriptional regulator